MIDSALIEIADCAEVRRLICAVLMQAMCDAKDGDKEAREWLCSDYAHALAVSIGIGDHFPPTEAQIGAARRVRYWERVAGANGDTNDLYGLSIAVSRGWARYRRRQSRIAVR